MLFKLNYVYYRWRSYKDDVNLCSKFKSANKLLAELKELIIICRKNLYYTQKFQKKAYNKGVKLKSYISSNKVWFNNKYIKIIQN